MNKKYDIAISFAGEDREVASEIASYLEAENVCVFYDDFEKADLWGKDLYEYLISVYRDNSKYCLMILSESYKTKLWTSHERKAAQARAFRENEEYILPLKLDDTEVPGILETIAYLDLRTETTESVSQLILKKLWGDVSKDKGLESIKGQLEALYMATMLVCELSFIPSSHPDFGKRGLAPELLIEAKDVFAKLKSDLQIKAPTIATLVLSEITEVLDAFDDILERALFLLHLRQSAYRDFFFIGEIPEVSFEKVYEFLRKLNIFDEYVAKSRRHFKPSEIVSNWRLAECEEERFLSEPENFKWDNKHKPLVFNSMTLRRLSIDNISSNASVQLFRR